MCCFLFNIIIIICLLHYTFFFVFSHTHILSHNVVPNIQMHNLLKLMLLSIKTVSIGNIALMI